MRTYSLNVRLNGKLHLQKHITIESPRVLSTYENMTLLTATCLESIEINDPNDSTTTIDIIKAISETVHDQLMASKETIHETEAQV